MMRPDFFLIAKNAGWVKGQPLTPAIRTAIRQALRVAFKTPQGIQSLMDAPRTHFAEKGVEKFRTMDIGDAIEALLEEIDVKP